MGYAMTKILLYGVKLDQKIAKIISGQMEDDEMNNEESEDIPDYFGDASGHFFRQLDDYSLKKEIISQETPISPYKQHDRGCESLFNIQMLSDGTDSRIHSLTYDDGYESYIGIFICRSGYAWKDDLNWFLKNPPNEDLVNFEKYLKPFKKKHKIKSVPSLCVITQTR